MNLSKKWRTGWVVRHLASGLQRTRAKKRPSSVIHSVQVLLRNPSDFLILNFSSF
jgi:hypothetical protein